MHTLDHSLSLALLERHNRLGAWRVDWPSMGLHWSWGMYSIHGLTGPAPPRLVDALAHYPASDRRRLAEAVRACATEGRPFDEELRFRRRGGPRGWVRVLGEAVREQSGATVAVQGILEDVTDEREAREEVARRHQRFGELADAMPVMVWAADAAGRVEYANGHLRRYAGAEAVEELGPVVRAPHFVHAEDAAALRACWSDALQTGEGAECEARLRRLADGEWRWHACALVPVRDAAGRLLRWYGTGIDVHDRVVSTQEALALARRLRGTLESITDGFFVIDRRWRFALINAKGEQLLGRARDELLGKVVWAEFPAAIGSEFERAYRRARSTGHTVSFEAYYPAPLDKWFRVRAYPSDDGLAVYFVDITAPRAADRLLRDSEERHRAISRTVTDAVWDWDLIADRITWNDGLRRHFGLSPELVSTGVRWLERVHPDDRDRVAADIHGSIDRREREWRCTYRFIRGDGAAVTVEDHGALIVDQAGVPTRFVGGLRDITTHLLLEDQLRRSQRLEALGHLVGGVAHDFNNLLTVIRGNSELLEEDPAVDGSRRELARMTREAADRGADLTHRLLAFARKQPLAPQVIDLRELIESMGALLERALREDITLTLGFDPSLRPAFADPSQLEATLLNLVINARDAMGAGGRLGIQCQPTALDDDYVADHPEVAVGEYVRITVSDTGSGIRREDLSRVFEPFFTTKRPGKGTGLGLSMAYGFARQSGGHIQIYSEPGHGTTVKLYLPMVGAGEAAPRWRPKPREAEAPRLHAGELTVLVVEDDDLVRQNVVRQIGRLGYRVTAVADARSALRVLGDGSGVDLVFTDVVLAGGMSGPELARELRRLHPELPVLFTSGYSDELIAQQGHLDQDVTLLAKPYTRAELARALESMLGVAGP